MVLLVYGEAGNTFTNVFWIYIFIRGVRCNHNLRVRKYEFKLIHYYWKVIGWMRTKGD